VKGSNGELAAGWEGDDIQPITALFPIGLYTSALIGFCILLSWPRFLFHHPFVTRLALLYRKPFAVSPRVVTLLSASASV